MKKTSKKVIAVTLSAVGVDTEKVMETMQNFHLSLHCWQADDADKIAQKRYSTNVETFMVGKISTLYLKRQTKPEHSTTC